MKRYPSLFSHKFVIAFIINSVVTPVFSLPTTYDQRQQGELNVQIHLKDVQVLALLDTELLDDYTEYDYFYDYADFTVKPSTKPTTSSPTTSVDPWSVWPTNPATTAAPAVSTPSELENLSNNVTQLSVSSSTSSPSSSLSVTESEAAVEEITLATESAVLSTSLEKVENGTKINEKNESSVLQTETTTKETKVVGLSRNNRCPVGYRRDGKGHCVRIERRVTLKRGNSGNSGCPAGQRMDKSGACVSIGKRRRRFSIIPLALKLAPKTVQDILKIRTTKEE